MLLNGHDHHSMSTGRHVPFRGFDPYDEVRTARRRLPHWRQPGVSYFVTFRLAEFTAATTTASVAARTRYFAPITSATMGS